MDFYPTLKKNLILESGNDHKDNYDYMSHGPLSAAKKRAIRIKSVLFHPIVYKLLTSQELFFRSILLDRILKMNDYMDGIAHLYDLLEDEQSKDLLIKIVSFRIMGHTKVRLPYHNDSYWSDLEKLKAQRREDDFIELPFKPWKLYHHDLNAFGLDIKLYYTTHRTYAALIREHYKFESDKKLIDVKQGDVVLDLGGCYGDTALYFSNKIGNGGKVYSFEFIPGSIDIFNKNLDLNPALKGPVEIVRHPLWNESGKDVYYQDKGGASKVSFEEFDGSEGKTSSITLDDFVNQKDLNKVDFIKTDIEGAEPYVLEGALETIKKFKPTMAISIYHNLDDFTGIVKMIDDLKLGYQFYLGHASIYASETVLFCTVN